MDRLSAVARYAPCLANQGSLELEVPSHVEWMPQFSSPLCLLLKMKWLEKIPWNFGSLAEQWLQSDNAWSGSSNGSKAMLGKIS